MVTGLRTGQLAHLPLVNSTLIKEYASRGCTERALVDDVIHCGYIVTYVRLLLLNEINLTSST